MDSTKRKALTAAGFHVGDAKDFLGLTDEETRLVELRVALSRAVRRRRQEQCMTQQQLATRLKSSQSRIAKIESGAGDVSLDLMFRGLFAVGGGLADVASGKKSSSSKRVAAPRRATVPTRSVRRARARPNKQEFTRANFSKVNARDC